jgi:hypothetical protein
MTHKGMKDARTDPASVLASIFSKPKSNNSSNKTSANSSFSRIFGKGVTENSVGPMPKPNVSNHETISSSYNSSLPISDDLIAAAYSVFLDDKRDKETMEQFEEAEQQRHADRIKNVSHDDNDYAKDQHTLSSGSSRKSMVIKLPYMIRAIWRYNGRTILFVIIFVSTTFLLLPVAIDLYYVRSVKCD